MLNKSLIKASSAIKPTEHRAHSQSVTIYTTKNMIAILQVHMSQNPYKLNVVTVHVLLNFVNSHLVGKKKKSRPHFS